MEDKNGYVKFAKTGRNTYGVKTERLDVTLPEGDIEYIVTWARQHNVTVSRAVHDLIMAIAYHAQKGDYKPYENAKPESH